MRVREQPLAIRMGRRMGYIRDAGVPVLIPNQRFTCGWSIAAYIMEWSFPIITDTPAFNAAAATVLRDCTWATAAVADLMRAQLVDTAWEPETNRLAVGVTYGPGTGVLKPNWDGDSFSYTLEGRNAKK